MQENTTMTVDQLRHNSNWRYDVMALKKLDLLNTRASFSKINLNIKFFRELNQNNFLE